jgi:tetratricopeptide (TPR) repeat protein
MKHMSWVAAGMMVALLGSATLAVAQMELGTVQGTVKDENGQPIEGAVIKLTDMEHGREIEVKSDKRGSFYRRGLQAVEYEFVVEKPGYNPIKDHLKVSPGLEKRYDFKLVKAAPEGAEEFARGVEAYNRGDNAAAAAAFEAAVAKAPNLPEVHVNLALAYVRLSRTADAVAELEKASTLAPDDPRTLFQLGGAYVEMNSLDKAIAAFEKGLSIKSDLNDPLVYEATITLGAALFAKGDNDKAAEAFQKALAAKPGTATPKLGLAKVHASKGELDEALKLFREVAASAPGTPEAAEAQRFIAEIEKP